MVQKLRTRFTSPPLTLAVIARLGFDEKIPVSERFSTASCVCLLLLQAAQAEGFGAQWLTGWPAYDRPFLEGTLGLAPEERLAGTIAIGTPLVAGARTRTAGRGFPADGSRAAGAASAATRPAPQYGSR